MAGGPERKRRRTRTFFTSEDDSALVAWVSSHPRQGELGNSLWQAAAEAAITGHSWQSMRQRWKNFHYNKPATSAGQAATSTQSACRERDHKPATSAAPLATSTPSACKESVPQVARGQMPKVDLASATPALRKEVVQPSRSQPAPVDKFPNSGSSSDDGSSSSSEKGFDSESDRETISKRKEHDAGDSTSMIQLLRTSASPQPKQAAVVTPVKTRRPEPASVSKVRMHSESFRPAVKTGPQEPASASTMPMHSASSVSEAETEHPEPASRSEPKVGESAPGTPMTRQSCKSPQAGSVTISGSLSASGPPTPVTPQSVKSFQAGCAPVSGILATGIPPNPFEQLDKFMASVQCGQVIPAPGWKIVASQTHVGTYYYENNSTLEQRWRKPMWECRSSRNGRWKYFVDIQTGKCFNPRQKDFLEDLQTILPDVIDL